MQNKLNKFKVLFLILTSACAIKPITSNRQASDEIIQYKENSQKEELSKIIEGKQVARKEEFLALVYDKKVHSWIHYFSKKDKDRFERYLKNGYQYKALIEDIFSSYDLPKDLFYVGLIESGYNLGAKSRANAVGPWQFIRDTGKRYNLSINSKVDERRSIVKSTHAAARYFQDLYNIFGSWELALSGYNAGEYGVIRRIRGANTRDFYELSRMKKLPKETRNYVPKVLAAMEVAKNHHKYSVTIPNTKSFTSLKRINLRGSYSTYDLAKSYKVSHADLMQLNNDLKRNVTPYFPKDGYNLYVPSHAKSFQVSKLEEIKKESIKNRVSNTRYRKIAGEIYKVRKGDNLHSIAKDHHVRFSKLKKINNLKSSTIYIGQKIKIPQNNATIHTVKSGDYLIKIAKNYGTTVQNLRQLNKKSLKKIIPGQKILISYN